MSFSSNVKKEIAGLIPGPRHCRTASLAAVLTCIGRFEPDGKGGALLRIASDNADAVGKCFTLLQKALNINIDAFSSERNGVYVCCDADAVLRIGEEVSAFGDGGWAVSETAVVPAALLRRTCCRRSFVREMFLCAGSMSDPEREYHLEFDLTREAQARQLCEILGELEVPARITRRKKYHVVYVKDSAAIGLVLNMIGAHVSLLQMENSLILKEVRNSVNRRVNCETANIGKTVSAARRQIEDIRLLEERGILKRLPASLRRMAEVRIAYPESPLQELGAYMVPPVGKSGVNHRLRKLSELADNVRSGSGEEDYDKEVCEDRTAERPRRTRDS